MLLVPDISMIGYLIDKKLGAIIYNSVHNYILPFLIFLVGIHVENPYILLAAIVLMGHVGMDRMLGFGLKYPSNFKNAHTQKLVTVQDLTMEFIVRACRELF